MKKVKYFCFFIFILFNYSEGNKTLISNKYFNIIPNISEKQKYSHTKNDNLYFIFSIFRHGVRSPMDKELENGKDLLGGIWNQKAELSSTGRKQHYLIGAKNKLRYSDFINKEYDPKEVLIYSTNTNRTISSAQSQLLGLYNGYLYSNKSNLDININESEINLNSIIPPIKLFHKRDYHENILFKGSKSEFETTLQYSKFCPPMKELIEKNVEIFENNLEVDGFIYDFNNKYRDVLKKQYNIDDFSNKKEFKGFCDAYISDYFDEKNKKVLELFNKEGFNITELLYECYYYHGYYLFEIDGNGYAKNNSILSMSILMKKIIDIMKKRIEKDHNYINYDYPKYILISSHDTSLAMIQLFFKNIFNIDLDYPYLASNFVIELREYNDKFYIESYLNDYLKFNVSFEMFEKKVLHISYDEKYIINYCLGIKENSIESIDLLLLILIIIFVILFLLFLFLCSKNYNNIKQNNSNPNISSTK